MLSGISAKLGQAYQQLVKDNTLTDAQRKSIMRLARDFYAREASNQRQIDRRFEARARDAEVNFRPIPMEIPRPDPEVAQLLLMEGDETFRAMQGNPVFDAGDFAL